MYHHTHTTAGYFGEEGEAGGEKKEKRSDEKRGLLILLFFQFCLEHHFQLLFFFLTSLFFLFYDHFLTFISFPSPSSYFIIFNILLALSLSEKETTAVLDLQRGTFKFT